ncbi:MAG: PAS domain-containing protein, partial [Rhodopila sp.]
MLPLALWLWIAIQTRASALDTAMADQRRVVDAVGENVLKLLDTQALILDIVDRAAGGRDCSALRSDAQFQELLRLSAQQSPNDALLWVINADGRICMASDPQYVDDRDRSFREYFGGARDAGAGHYYVDRAIIGISRPIPAFNISKARWKDGAFNGIVLASPGLVKLIDHWNKTLDPARTQRISLFRQDGATIARSWPPLVPPPDPAVERRIVAAWTAPQGTNRGHSVVDGRPRIGAWRTLPIWNVVVSSSENEIEVLAPWRRSTIIYGTLATFVSALLGTLTWLLLRGRWALERTVEDRTHALRTSEARLKLATEGAGVGTWELDLVSGQGTWSPEAMALLGVWHPAFMIENWVEEAVHPEDRPQVATCWRQALADDAPYEMEFRPAIAPNASERWLVLRGRIERDAGGRPVRAAGILIDVTARKQAELALAQGETRFRAMADNIPQLAWMARPDPWIFWYNQRWYDYTGSTPAEVEGRGWRKFLHPDHRDRVLERITHAWDSGEPWEDTFPLRGKNGEYRWFLSRAMPIRDADGQVTLWFGTNTDVTGQRAAEAALAQSSERLRLALDAGRMGFWSWDLAPDRLEWDARQFELFGIDPAGGQPSGADALARVHPEDLPGLQEAIRAAMEPGDGVFGHEFRVRQPDGTLRWIAGHGHSLPGPDGRAARMVGLNFDITERRETEAALAASNQAARLAAERVQLALAAGAIVGTWMWDLPTDRLTADECFARSFGLDPKACRTGLGIEAVVASVHPEDKPRLMAAIAEVIARGGPYRCEYRVRQHDGVYRWIEANGRVDHAPDGTPLRFPGVLLDIEQRRAMQAERDRATALLRTFAEVVPGVVYAKDRDGRLLLANEGTAALIDKPPEAFIGNTDAEFLDDKRQAKAVMANDRRIMESGIAEEIEEAVSLADGTPAIWLSTKAPLRDASGAVIGLVGTSIDITARKQAEAALMRQAEDLERLAEQRGQALAESELRLAEAARMEALGR